MKKKKVRGWVTPTRDELMAEHDLHEGDMRNFERFLENEQTIGDVAVFELAPVLRKAYRLTPKASVDVLVNWLQANHVEEEAAEI
jgi:hypothetical protein